MLRVETNTLDFFRICDTDLKVESQLIDPLFRFTDKYFEFLKGCQLPEEHLHSIIIDFKNDTERERHVFHIGKKIEHMETASTINEQVLGYICIDILKRQKRHFLLTDLSTTTFQIDEKKKFDRFLLLDCVLQLRAHGKTLNLILKKLKSRGIGDFLCDFEVRGTDAWALSKNKKRKPVQRQTKLK